MRVLHIMPGEPKGSTFIFARRDVASLQRAGIDGCSYHVLSRVSPLALVKDWVRIRRVITQFQPHIIHTHYGTMTALLSALATTRPLVLTFQGSDLNPEPGYSWLRCAIGRLMSNLAALRAARIICVSQQLRSRLWWRRKCSSAIPSGVDLNTIFPMSRQEARKLLGWDDNDKVVLFNAGKFPAVKRLDLAEAAVAAAQNICADVRLVVLRGDVEPNRVPLFLNAADCLLVTSDWEGSPNIVKEALACNLPVVSVRVGDVPERLKSVVPSKIVERDPASLGAALCEIIQAPRRSNGREAIGEIAADRIAARISALYEAILQERQNPR
jgi:teichuronic acid biosynthesis glycosyltransferase TuaC